MTKINQRKDSICIFKNGKKEFLVVCNATEEPKIFDLKDAIHLKVIPKPILVKKYKKRLYGQ